MPTSGIRRGTGRASARPSPYVRRSPPPIPANAQLRLDLARSYVLVGDALVATGDLTGGLAHYRQSLAVREGLAAADPTNGQMRHELAVSYQRLGDTLGNPRFTNLGDTAGALESYRKMLAIFEALVAADPQNTRKRHSLSIGYEKMGRHAGRYGGPGGGLSAPPPGPRAPDGLSRG